MSPMKLVDGKLVEVDVNGNPVVSGDLVTSTDNVKTSEVGPLEGTHNNVPVAEIEKDAKDALLNSPGRLSQANEKLIEKIENEGRGAAERDLEEARRLGGAKGPNQPDNADSTVMRADGTVTTENQPNMTAMYLHGTKVLVSDEQIARYNDLLAELTNLQGDMGVSDIPLGDPYYTKKAELDAFVARLKR